MDGLSPWQLAPLGIGRGLARVVLRFRASLRFAPTGPLPQALRLQTVGARRLGCCHLVVRAARALA